MSTHRPQRTEPTGRTTQTPRPADDQLGVRLRELSAGLDQTRGLLLDAFAAMCETYDRQKRSEAARRGWENRRRAGGVR